jgi:hypothetical protein
MDRRMIGWRLAAMAVVVIAASPVQAEDERPAVVPYRPTVSNPAELPAPGYPELEGGYLYTRGGDAAHTQSLPLLFKLAWSENWGVLVGMDGYTWQRESDGTRVQSGGDVRLVLKQRIPVSEDLSFGVEYGVKLPAARAPIGTGKTDYGAVGIASYDWNDVRIDANLGGAWLGAVDEGQGRWQGAYAVAVSRPLDDHWGVAGEVFGVFQKGASANNQALAALSYNVSRALVLDVAAATRLSHNAPDWQLTAGFCVQLGHWF